MQFISSSSPHLTRTGQKISGNCRSGKRTSASLLALVAGIVLLAAGTNFALAQNTDEWDAPDDPTVGFDFGNDPEVQRSDQPIPPENMPQNAQPAPQQPAQPAQDAQFDDPDAVVEVDPDAPPGTAPDFDPNAAPDAFPDSGQDPFSDTATDDGFGNDGTTEDPEQVYEDGFKRDENGAIIAKPGTVIDPETGDPVTETEEDTRIANRIAVFSGLDKITGNIITFDVYIDETVQFGVLQVTPRVCYSRPPSQTPKTDAFIEVDEQTLDRKIRRIFTGWMFADSPGLNAIEHPIYDIWLKGCKMDSIVPAPDGTISSAATAEGEENTASTGGLLDEEGKPLPPVPEMAIIPIPERPPREEVLGSSN